MALMQEIGDNVGVHVRVSVWGEVCRDTSLRTEFEADNAAWRLVGPGSLSVSSEGNDVYRTIIGEIS